MGTYNFKEETGEMQFDASGNLKVNIQAGAGSGGTASVDDAAFTAASDSGTPMMGFVTADSVDVGDVGVVGMLANRQLKVTLYDSAGVELSVGGGTQYTEDAVSAANPVGNAINLIRQDTPASEVSANGDNISLRGTQYGAAYVQILDSSGNFINTFGGGTQYTEDAAAAADPVGTMAMAVRADTLGAVTSADGDNIALRSTNKGELYVKQTDAVPVTDNAGSLTVDNATLSVVGGGVEATALRVTIASDSTGVLSVDDNGGSLTVDGTVTANAGTGFPSVQTEDAASAGGETGVMILGVRNDAAASKTSLDGDFSAIATDAAGRVGIADLGGAISVDDNGSSLTIDNTTLAVVGGGAEATALRVTIASDSTGVLSVDDNGSSLTVDGTVTSNAGTGFPSVQTEDAASAGGETGIMLLGVRNDAAASKTSLDGDFSAIATDAAGRVGIADLGGSISIDDNAGSLTIDNATLSVVGGGVEAAALRVTIASDSTGVLSVDDNGGSLTVDNGGTFAVQDSQVIADNAGFTDGTSKVFTAGYIFDDVAGTALTENDAAAARIDSKRAQMFVLEDATTRGQKLSVSAAGAAHINLAQVGANTVNTGAGASGTGTQRVVTSTDSTIGTVTSVTQNADVRQSTASNFNAQVVGSIAHDGVDSGNPVKVGMRALAHGTNPTAVAAADRTDWLANRAGIPWVMGGHPNVVTVRANYTAAQTDTAIVTVAAGLKIVVTRCSVTADNANTVDVAVRIGFGAVNTPSATGVVLSHPGIAPGSGVVEGTGAGMIGVGADDEDLRITSEVPTTGSIDVVVTYYTIES